MSESNLNKNKITQDFEHKIRLITQSNEDLDRKCHEYDTKLSYANQEIEHLQNVVKSKIE